jgi:hypothetical protein
MVTSLNQSTNGCVAHWRSLDSIDVLEVKSVYSRHTLKSGVVSIFFAIINPYYENRLTHTFTFF